MKLFKYLLVNVIIVAIAFYGAYKVVTNKVEQRTFLVQDDLSLRGSPIVLSEELEKVRVKPRTVEEWTQEEEVKSSVVYYTEYRDTANNTFAYLTVGSSNGVRRLVVDPATMRKVNTIEITSGEYTATPGSGVTTATFEGKTVFNYFSNAMGLHKTTRVVTFSSDIAQPLMLKNAKVIIRYAGGGSNYMIHTNDVDVSYTLGTLTASFTFGSDMEPYPSVDYAYLVFDGLYGTKIPINVAREDLTESDYYFMNTEGNATLGTLRRWIKDRYDDITAYYWYKHPAQSSINLDDNAIIFDSGKKFYTRYHEYSSTNKVLQFIANGMNAIEIKLGEFATDADFQIRKIDWENNNQDFCMYIDTYGDEPYVVACDNLNEEMWYRPDQVCDYDTTYNIDGRTCYKVVITLDAGKASSYYQARVKGTGMPSAYVRTEVPIVTESGVYLRDENGVTWKLGVNTSGALTTTREIIY